VVYAARTVAGRTWSVEPRHRSVELRGVSLPGASRLVHHDYPVTPGIWRELRLLAPDVVVVSGWSTFAAQAALAWCRARGVPYVLLVVSHDQGPRAGWRAAVKGAVVPRLVRGAAGVLAVGSLARDSVLARGAAPDGIRVFANTIDVASFAERADQLAGRRHELRAAFGLTSDDVAVLSVSRLAPEKRHDLLVRAVAAARDPRLALVLVGDGPERSALERLAADLGVRLTLAGDRPWEEVVEAYVAADVFALLSERETWGVVVNEAAACGLPLVLSDRVGAAADLLCDGENGVLVPAGDVEAAAAALARLAADADLRRAAGARSREIVSGWGYDPSVEAFVDAVREAASR
jgi:glycosyltransferase involved in cell wall biosynthesis